jgi:DNA-binding transcriptional LysR family regulator
MRRFNIKMDGQIAALAVAEKGSYSAAGKSLDMTTSAVRKQVEGLSTEVGTPIFQRLGGRLKPTEAGDIYLPDIRESVRRARVGLDRAQAFVRAQANNLQIGYSSHLPDKLLDNIVQLGPEGTRPSSRESLLTYQVVSRVLRAKLHVGFGFLPIHEPELLVRPLMQEPLVACLPAGHRLSGRPSIELSELENEPMIAVARRAVPDIHKEIAEHFEGEGIVLKFVCDAYLPREAQWLVSRGMGLALMSRSLATPLRPDVVLRSLSTKSLTVKTGIFARRDHHVSYIKEFIDAAWATTAALRPKPAQPHSEETQ